MGTTTEQQWEALAALLVISDFSDPGARAAFAKQLAEASATLGSDPVSAAVLGQLASTLEGIERGEDVAAASAILSELISAALQLCVEEAESARPVSLPQESNVYASDPTVVADFVCGAAEQLDSAEALLSSATTGGSVDVGALFRCFHTLKGMAGFLSLDEFANVSHAAETVLERVRAESRDIRDDEIERALESVDAMRSMIASLGEKTTPGASRRTAERRTADHVRVNAARLEELLDAMGELAVAEAELAAAVKATGDPDSLRCLERLQRIARDMQGTSTSLRMVTLKQTFAKMSRVVRDSVAHSGNIAELVVSGEDTEIDRALVEGLSDPLVHLLRNAVDHGIESPAERRAHGKPEKGRVELRAYHRSGSVFIEIEDDGRGIDSGRLARRADELGMDYDRDHPLALIFRPGFSTSSTVTALSGRGVGMDAVQSSVTAMRGTLEVDSTPGTGSRFTIRLPLTLAIVDGIVLRAGVDRYVVPTHFVQRTTSVTGNEMVSTAGRGQVLVLPDGPVPVADIANVMGGRTDSGDVAVVLVDGDDRFALIVDEVIGQQSLVIKPLTGPTTKAVGPAGAALMGDGRVALVVDPSGLSRALRRGQ